MSSILFAAIWFSFVRSITSTDTSCRSILSLCQQLLGSRARLLGVASGFGTYWLERYISPSDLMIRAKAWQHHVSHISLLQLIKKLADSALGAIVTHAVVTSSGEYICASESGFVIYWNVPKEEVISFLVCGQGRISQSNSITSLFCRWFSSKSKRMSCKLCFMRMNQSALLFLKLVRWEEYLTF